MASLRDVARHAGVSVATASRVASGLDNVRSETRERVERAMRELLYVPSGRRTETGVIGLLLPDFENPIFPELAHAIERTAGAAAAFVFGLLGPLVDQRKRQPHVRGNLLGAGALQHLLEQLV